MENLQEHIFTVGELANKTGVTVRTLQYYDKIGLLKSGFSEGGRRMYTPADVFKLQQILFLRSFGFSLEEISSKILNNKSAASLEQLFTGQREMLLGQIDNLNKIVGLLNTVIDEVKIGGEIGPEKLMAIMALMKNENPYAYFIHYFGDEELKSVSERFTSPEQAENYLNSVQGVFAQLNSLYRNGDDPAGPAGQELARSWWNMVGEFTAGDPGLMKPLLSAGMDIGNWPKEISELQDAIENFLKKALEVYFINNGIKLPETEAINNE